MASLENVKVKDSYTSLLKLSGNTDTLADGTGSNAIQVVDGNGDASPLYLNTDRLGIGVQPLTVLQIKGSPTVLGDSRYVMRIEDSTSVGAGVGGGIVFGGVYNSGGTTTNFASIWGEKENATDSNSSGQLHLGTRINGGSISSDLVISSTGNVGIGGVPTAKLDIHGDTGTWGGMAKVFLTDVNSNSSSRNWSIGNGGTAYGALSFIVSNSADGVPADSTGTAIMNLDSNSRISLSNNDSGTGGADSSSANTILGYLAGANIGSEAHTNVLIGHKSGNAMIGGRENVAIGVGALDADQYGEYSIAIGASALGTQNDSSNSGDDGMSNIGIGRLAGSIISNGQYNICIGESSGSTGTNNLSTGDKNVLVGRLSGSGSADAQNRVAIGHEATGVADNSVTLGNADVTDVYMSQDSQAYVHAQNVPNHVANTMSSPYYRFDGVNDEIAIADNNHMSFGDGTTDSPFSISAWIYMEDATSFSFIHKGTFNSDAEWNFWTQGDDKLYFVLYDESESSTFEGVFTSELTSYENQWIHLVGTYNGVGGSSALSGLKIYINGVSQTTTGVEGGTYVAMENLGDEVRIGNLNDSTYGQGSIACLRVWNKELTATEIKDDYSGASVPFKYKGANQTNLLTGGDADFGSTAGGWTNATLGGGYNETGDITTTATSAGQYFANNVLSKTVGKRYRLTFDVSSLVSTWTIQEHDDGDSAGSIGTVSADGSQSFEFTSKFALGFRFVAGANDSSANFDNFSVVPIGAVCELDGSGAGEKVWGDKSGNDLHGTVSGATLENTPYDSGTEYEEGTFTPSLGGNTSYNAQVGNYTKIGRKVTCIMSLNINAIGTGSTHTISGLPYPSMNATEASGYVGFFSGSANTVSTINPSVNNDASTITLCSVGGSGATTTATATAIFANSTSIRINVTYFTD